jgi:uncharacterized protein
LAWQHAAPLACVRALAAELESVCTRSARACAAAPLSNPFPGSLAFGRTFGPSVLVKQGRVTQADQSAGCSLVSRRPMPASVSSADSSRCSISSREEDMHPDPIEDVSSSVFAMRRQIAADPDRFFAHADHDGNLSWPEWEQACSSFFVLVVEPELYRVLFDQLDVNGKGKVSKEKFVAIRLAIRLFIKGAECQDILVEALAGLVTAHLSKAPWQCKADTSCNTLEALTWLSEQEMLEELVHLPKSLKRHCCTVKQEREDRSTKIASLQVDRGEGKFADLPTAAYGDKDSFHKGLEVVGLPHPHVLDEMRREHLEGPDSKESFEACGPGGSTHTTSEKEWYFVFDPFQEMSVRADKDPEDWVPRFDYHGNRMPIRRQVFMHVLSAKPMTSKDRFGNYTNAHELPQNDPRWLHTKEVDMVRVVMCRVIKSQLDGMSLQNAFKVMQMSPDLQKAVVKAKKIVTALSEGLRVYDGPSSRCTFGLLVETVVRHGAATHEELELLVDHFHTKFATNLIHEAEVISARLYTGPAFVKFNASLRESSGLFPEEWTRHLKDNRYTNAIYACNSMLQKLSRVSRIPAARFVYRGICGVNLPESFVNTVEGGGRGGVDFGFLSTTTEKDVAVSYLGGKIMPLLFEIRVGDMDRGADLSFLSQYPLEEEVLMPPLSYIEVVDEPFQMETSKGTVNVYPCSINCNLKSQTIDEIDAHRQKEVLSLLPYLKNEALHLISTVTPVLQSEAFAQDQIEVIQLHKHKDELVANLDATFDQIVKEKDAQFFHDDQNYKKTINDAIDLKLNQIGALVEPVYGVKVSGSQVILKAAERGHARVVQALLDGGASAASVDNDGRTSLILALENGHKGAAEVLLKPSLKVGLLDMRPNSGYKRTALMWASALGLVDMVEKLLEHGANPELADIEGKTSLMLALFEGHETVAEMLLTPTRTAGALEVRDTYNQNMTALMIASASGLFGMVEKLLEHGAKPELMDRDGNTSLMLALEQGHDAASEVLLKPTIAAGLLDAQPTTENSDFKRSALMHASAAGLTSMVKKLLERGAKVELTDHDGMNSFMIALEGRHEQTAELLLAPTISASGLDIQNTRYPKRSALMIASDAGLSDMVKKMLELGAKPELMDDLGKTSLMMACANGHEVAATMLLAPTIAAGLIDLQDTQYTRSALMWAGASGLSSVVEKLLEYGASSGLTNRLGMTALMLACAHGKEETAKLLVAPTHAADLIDLRSAGFTCFEDGFSALMWAEDRGLLCVAQMLRDCGAAAVRRPALSLFRWRTLPDWLRVRLDVSNRIVTFNTFSTLRSTQRCPLGAKSYYEIEILELGSNPQWGFASGAFERMHGASCDDVGDDAHSWAIDGVRQTKRHNAVEYAYQCLWKPDDVVGLACDLDAMQIFVSVNGSFAVPNGLVFELSAEAVHDGLFAALTWWKGRLRYNFGEVPFLFKPPSDDYLALTQFEY